MTIAKWFESQLIMENLNDCGKTSHATMYDRLRIKKKDKVTELYEITLTFVKKYF